MRSVKEIRTELATLKRAAKKYASQLERANKRIEELKEELVEALTAERTGKK